MRRPSVAQEDIRERRRRLHALTPDDRIALALDLGRRHLIVYAEAQGLTLLDAQKILDRRRQARRRTSACLEALLW